MKQTRCWILLTTILVGCAVGCAKREDVLAEVGTFEVDGVQYELGYYAGWNVHVNQPGQVASSFLTLNCNVTWDRPNYKPILVTINHDSARNIRSATLLLPDGKEVVPKAETLYFAKDEKTLVEKGYRELGIEASQLKARHEAMFNNNQYLRPILKQLIRENVTPHEPEMEEEQP